MTLRTPPLRNAVESHLDSLRKLEPAQLRALPEHSEFAIAIADATRFITTWRQPLAEGATLIVVQAKHDLVLGIGFMIAEGFVVTPEGILKTPSDEQLSDYR